MIRPRDDLSVRRQCELLDVNRSTLYYQAKTPDEEARAKREEIMRRIDYWHTVMPYIGSRKIVVLLQKEGYPVGRKYVRRCMGEMGIHALYPKPNLSKRNFKEATVPYLLRNFNASFPNQVWSVDITYIPLHRSHMYLTAIIDWCSRKVVGHSLSDSLDTASVIEAVKAAIKTYGVPAIINSDQGAQFTSKEYKSLLKQCGIRQSMDGKSRWADNVLIERWFRSLKTEKLYISEYHSPRELRRMIQEYIREYNEIRPHESLGNRTPSEAFTDCFLIA